MEKVRIKYAIDKIYISLINRGAVDRLTKALDNVIDGKVVEKDIIFARLTEEMLDEINAMRVLQNKKPLTKRNVTAFAGAINNHLTKHLKEYKTTRKLAQVAFSVLTSSKTLVLPGDSSDGSKGTLLVKRNYSRFADSVTLGDADNGKTSLKNISPRAEKQIKNLSKERNILKRRLGRGENYPTSDTE